MAIKKDKKEILTKKKKKERSNQNTYAPSLYYQAAGDHQISMARREQMAASCWSKRCPLLSYLLINMYIVEQICNRS